MLCTGDIVKIGETIGKVIKASKIDQRWWFLVLWNDGTKTWHPESELNDS